MPQYTAKQKDNILLYIKNNSIPRTDKEYKDILSILKKDGYVICVQTEGSIKETIILSPKGEGFINDGGYSAIEKEKEKEDAINKSIEQSAKRSADAAEKANKISRKSFICSVFSIAISILALVSNCKNSYPYQKTNSKTLQTSNTTFLKDSLSTKGVPIVTK